MYRVAVIIVNYRTPGHVADCLASLAPEIDPAQDYVVVVDNGSCDDSVERLSRVVTEHGWTDWIKILDTGENLGFSAGNNQGIGHCKARYYWLLNPDTIVRQGALDALVLFMSGRPIIGVAGSELEDMDGRRHRVARNCLKPLSEFMSSGRTGLIERLLGILPIALPESDSPQPCDWVSGASMMVRREVFDKIGLLDEGYFLYFEELDLCERARAAGWEVWHVPQSRVVHLFGQSTGIQYAKRRRPDYWFNSRRRFFLKRYGVRGLITADCCWLLGRCVFWFRQLTGIGRRLPTDPKWVTWDILSGDVCSILSGEALKISGETRCPKSGVIPERLL